jgi:hypothetical protein
MRNLLLIVGAVVALSACSKSKIDQAIADTEDFKSRMCACADKTDKDCAEKVQTEFKEWRHKLKETISKDEAKNLPKETQKKLEDSFEEFEKCSKKARGGGDSAGGDDNGKAGEAMAKMTGFKDKMCACKDKACADGVQKEMMEWTTGAMKDAANMKMSADDTKKMTDVAKAMSECAATAMSH